MRKSNCCCCCCNIGPTGLPGPQGVPGPNGLAGTSGPMGPTGVAGPEGPFGSPATPAERTLITVDFAQSANLGNNIPLQWDPASPNTIEAVFEVTPPVASSPLIINEGIFLTANTYHISITFAVLKNTAPPTSAGPAILFIGNASATPVGPLQTISGYDGTAPTAQPYNVYYDYYVTIPTAQIYYVFTNLITSVNFSTPSTIFRITMWNVELIQ